MALAPLAAALAMRRRQLVTAAEFDNFKVFTGKLNSSTT